MLIRVLGAAAGGGFPQWNAASAANRRAFARDATAPSQTQSSLAVSADGRDWVLLNASPDLRQQILATPALHPRKGPRSSPIAAVVLTNADVDHIAGLLSLREGHAFAIHATAKTLATLAANPVFNVLDAGLVARHAIALGQPFAPIAGIEAVAFAVPGKTALYLERADAPDFGSEPEDTIGLEIRETRPGARFFYIPACREMTEALARRLAGAPLLFFDGTLYTDDEMLRSGEGKKTGRRMGHMPMTGEGGALEAFAEIPVARKLFIHINNSNPVLLRDSPERRAVEAAGWEVAADGMEIAL